MVHQLTPKQREALVVIQGYCARGLPPSQRELASELGLSSINAVNQCRVAPLVRKGMLEVEFAKGRALRVTPLGLRTLGIPIGPRRCECGAEYFGPACPHPIVEYHGPATLLIPGVGFSEVEV